MKEIEFGKKKAAGPYAIKATEKNGRTYFMECPEYSQPGDSGSPIIYKNPDTGALSIIGVVTGYEFPCLDEAQIKWIKKAGEIYADAKRRGDI